jgi:hypothetical protein
VSPDSHILTGITVMVYRMRCATQFMYANVHLCRAAVVVRVRCVQLYVLLETRCMSCSHCPSYLSILLLPQWGAGSMALMLWLEWVL